MRSGLKDGKLVPPRSLRVAQARYDRLLGKIAEVTKQLDERPRCETEAFKQWAARARHALEAFESERVQLHAWIADALLRRCRDALRSFKDEGTEMSAGELALLDQLDEYFSKETDDAGR